MANEMDDIRIPWGLDFLKLRYTGSLRGSGKMGALSRKYLAIYICHLA
jgi:hypothetical protein